MPFLEKYQNFKEANGWSNIMLLILGGVAIGLFGTGYGVVFNNISNTTLEALKKDINIIFGIDAVLILLLMGASLLLIKSNPSMFQPYILVISHVTLLIALLSLSYSVLKLSN